MRFAKCAALAISLLSIAGVANAADKPVLNEPATLGFGVGYYDIFENSPRKEAVDFRLEYRSSFDMLGLAKAHNSVIAIRPMAGIEVTSDNAHYVHGGFVFDIPFARYFVLSPSSNVGFYNNGDGKYLGSFIEFRNQVELGVKLDNGMRLTGAVGHISNAGLTSKNHGVEIATMYVHVPVEKIFGK